MSNLDVHRSANYNEGLKPSKYTSISGHTNEKKKSSNLKSNLSEIRQLAQLMKKHGVYSVIELETAGFKYTGSGATARCDQCGFEMSDWTTDVKPFEVHSINSPNCPIVLSIKNTKPCTSTASSSFKKPLPSAPSLTTISSLSSPTTAVVRSASISNDQETPSKRQKTETNQDNPHRPTLFELDKIQQIRRRTFSHWPHRTTPSQGQMIEAGFFNCNVGDRVICIYCNLICQQWTPHTDDPCEVHKTLSPKCPYVKAKLIRRELGAILIVNENTGGATANGLEQIRSNELVHTAACNPAYAELPKRTASFTAWPNENLPAVDELVKAGFFFTGTKNIVTCFYCNGSLQNWGSNDNPMIEHARWFPHCAYAKQLCGDELYRKIQESKRAQQERAKANESKGQANSNALPKNSSTSNSRLLSITDESTLSRLVAARLDTQIAQRLLSSNYKLSIIKRCIEDQLRLKLDDFATESDLHMACMILQKQIERIDGKKENIVIPSVRMKKIREDAERKRTALVRGQAVTTIAEPADVQSASTTSNNADVEMTTLSQSATNESTSSTESTSRAATTGNQEEGKLPKPFTSNISEKNQTDNSSSANPCVLCLSEEKRLACIPCGHLATCVPCGHSLRSCPICRREIEAFVRIYI